MSCILLVLQTFNARFRFALTPRAILIWWTSCRMIADKSRFMLDYGLGSVWVCGLRWCGWWLSGYLAPHSSSYFAFSGAWLCVLRTCAWWRGLVMMVFCCWDGIMSSRWCAVGMVGLCLRSRGRALLRCIWDGVRCLLDCVLCRGVVSGSLGWIAVLRLWVVVYIVISLAFHQVRFPWIRVSYWLFHQITFPWLRVSYYWLLW